MQGDVKSVDHMGRKVVVDKVNGGSEELGFHALVVATGAVAASPLLGLQTNEMALKEAWSVFREALPRAKHVVVCGGGPTGVEVAGELGEYLNGRAGWFMGRMAEPRVKVTLVTSAREILPALRTSIAQAAEGYLAKVGVTIIKEMKVVAVEPDHAGLNLESIASEVMVTLSDGSTLDADLYIPATGTRPNTSYLDPSLLEPSNQIKTNPQSLRVEEAGPRIYAIGDASSFARPAIHNITAAVPVLGANIKRDLLVAAGVTSISDVQDKHFEEDSRETQMVPIGKTKGVGAAMGWRLPSWMVWAIKGRDYWLWTTPKLWSGRQWAKEG